MRLRWLRVVALLSVGACGGGSPGGAPGPDASLDGSAGGHGGAAADAGSTGDEGGIPDGSATAAGDGEGSGGSEPSADAGPCAFESGGKYVLSCVVGAGSILPQCVEDHTTLAACTTEAQNCAANGGVPGTGCTTAGLTGCCFTPSTGAEVCLYDDNAAQDDAQAYEQRGGTWSTMP
jgi:hypothetical protein